MCVRATGSRPVGSQRADCGLLAERVRGGGTPWRPTAARTGSFGQAAANASGPGGWTFSVKEKLSRFYDAAKAATAALPTKAQGAQPRSID